MNHLFRVLGAIRNKKKLVYVKAFVYGNLGDDLFIKVLTDHYKDYQFLLVGSKEFEMYYSIDNLLYLSYDRFYYKILNVISRLINRSDFISYMQKLSKANVYITGSDFIEKDNWNEGRLVDNFWNKKLFVLGINFGPFRTKEFLDYYRNLFSKTSNVCVRDKVSLEYFKDLPIVHYAPDVVFNLKYKSVKNPNDVVLISVIDPTKDNLINVKVKDQYINGLAKIINKLIDSKLKIKLVSFCEKQKDAEIAKIISERCNKSESVEIIRYLGNCDAIIDEFYNAKVIIATRYHAMVLGMLFDKIMIPVCYDNKMNNVLNDLNYTGNIFNIDDIESFADQIVNLVKNKVKGNFNFTESPIKQFEALDEYLD